MNCKTCERCGEPIIISNRMIRERSDKKYCPSCFLFLDDEKSIDASEELGYGIKFDNLKVDE